MKRFIYQSQTLQWLTYSQIVSMSKQFCWLSNTFFTGKHCPQISLKIPETGYLCFSTVNTLNFVFRRLISKVIFTPLRSQKNGRLSKEFEELRLSRQRKSGKKGSYHFCTNTKRLFSNKL